MKFTDQFFSFPIKVYDSSSIRDAEIQEESMNIRMEPVWYEGICRMAAKDFEKKKVYWHDGYTAGKDVDKEGFDITIIVHEVNGTFVCTWSRFKFEKELNEFMEQNYQSWSQKWESLNRSEKVIL